MASPSFRRFRHALALLVILWVRAVPIHRDRGDSRPGRHDHVVV